MCLEKALDLWDYLHLYEHTWWGRFHCARSDNYWYSIYTDIVCLTCITPRLTEPSVTTTSSLLPQFSVVVASSSLQVSPAAHSLHLRLSVAITFVQFSWWSYLYGVPLRMLSKENGRDMVAFKTSFMYKKIHLKQFERVDRHFHFLHVSHCD